MTKNGRPHEHAINQVYDTHLEPNRDPLRFGDLSLYDYSELFTPQEHWRKYKMDSPRGIWEISDGGRAWLAEQERGL
ncbi:MAG: hypothetical protein KDE51_06570 [Anaerolineales bacterium]|nr:hypothetical protein [Anaerolineales bacterium]